MKQATKSFTQPSVWRKRLPGYAAMGAASVALALGLTGLMQARTTVSGTLLPLSDADAATYGISSVYQLEDGAYLVTGAKKGFQSEVQAAVTLDAEGNVLKVEILSQDETASLGGHCVDPEFTDQYKAAAPFTLAGKSYTVTDPATGASYAAAGSTETAAPQRSFDPARWNVNDTSPEAEAMRKMYAAGLTLSALNGEPMDEPLGTSPEAIAHEKLYEAGLTLSALNGEKLTVLPDTKDNSPEWTAMRKMYEAGLTLSALNGEKLEKPVMDWSAEELAQYRMEQAGLTTGAASAEQTGTAQADLTEVDALSGATITSAAVTDVVNNSYFYVTEVLGAE